MKWRMPRLEDSWQGLRASLRKRLEGLSRAQKGNWYRWWALGVAGALVVAVGLNAWYGSVGRYVAPYFSVGQETPGPSESDFGDTVNGQVLGTQEPGQEAAQASASVDATGAAANGASTVTFRWPVTGNTLVGYGWGYSDMYGDYRFHTGVDLEAKDGEPVRAAADGTVMDVTESRLWGWQVKVDHGNGFISVYSDLASVQVKKGDPVKAGDPLGNTGGDGLAEAAEGPHVHFEILVNGTHVDPSTRIGR